MAAPLRPGPVRPVPEPLTAEQQREADLATVCSITFAWAEEHGFGDPEAAREVWDAAKRLRPDLEPEAPTP